MLPGHVRSLFWDVDPGRFDPAAHPRYTIERVLEHGEEEDVAWLTRVFSQDQIHEVLRTSRHLSPRSAHFWALVFGRPASGIATGEP